MKIKNIRQKMYHKYGGRCAYCGCILEEDFHIDHITPKIMGGSNDIENKNPACKHCNVLKYTYCLDLEGFRRLLIVMLNEEAVYLNRFKMLMALDKGAVVLIKWDGKFYFEKLQQGDTVSPLVMRSADGHSVDDDDMHWTVKCPTCERELEYTGYFDSGDTNKCGCGTEFKTRRVYFDNGSYME